jgi:anti-sigma regulatory factor (Ser/Thr protein kinase)
MTARTWSITEVNPTIVRSTRHQFADVLRRLGYDESAVEAGTFILGELLANACEHGMIPVRIELRNDGKHWKLRVDDAGRGIRRPAKRDPNALRGRGFEIIERLGARLRIAAPPRSTVEVVLPL